jgi:hypothetical protein
LLRRIIGPNRNEILGGWRKLPKEELHKLYTSLYIIRMIKKRRMGRAGHIAYTEERNNAYRILVGKPEGKRPLAIPKRWWVDNIKMGLREIGRDGMDLILLAQDRYQWGALVNTVKNLRVPLHVGKFLRS